jgi:hypothetical protein
MTRTKIKSLKTLAAKRKRLNSNLPKYVRARIKARKNETN